MLRSIMDGETKSGGFPHWIKTVVFGRNPKRTAIRLAILIVGSFVVFKFVLIPVKITGISMEPTYHNGRVDFINRLAYVRNEPQRGDIVGIRLAGNHVLFMKRIIGLPGETVAFSRGTLMIDGQPMEEPYVKAHNEDWDSSDATLKEVKLKSNEYYVVGDNREMPPSYHEHGTALRNRIVGKLLL
jgi:signal peptidase I